MKKILIVSIMCLFVGCISSGKNVKVNTTTGSFEFKDAVVLEHSEEIWIVQRDMTIMLQTDQIEEITIR